MQWPYHHLNTNKDNCGFGLIADLSGAYTHKTVTLALEALSRLKHRGAVGADGKTGDGCGISIAMPRAFFQHLYANLSANFAVGMVFLNTAEAKAQYARNLLEEYLNKQQLSVFCWRKVPLDTQCCGETALQQLPTIEQCIIEFDVSIPLAEVERRLFIARKQVSSRIEQHDPYFYIASLSCYTLVYKALVLPEKLASFYSDLNHETVKSDFALFHQRFSTNTSPQWWLAQPFRILAHNGEINTIQANRLSVIGRRNELLSSQLSELFDVNPLINLTGSDSSSLDNVAELLVRGGLSLAKAMRILIPPAWENHPFFSDQAKAFYDYYALPIEPWDGPAGIVMSDGVDLACCLDRNGLRPARYSITSDKYLTLCSESGVLDFPDKSIEKKGRVKPGEMLLIKRTPFDETKSSSLLMPHRVDESLYQEAPYHQWLQQKVIIKPDFEHPGCNGDTTQVRAQHYFNVHYEEVYRLIVPLAEQGLEAVGSMGDDTPLAILSDKPRSLFDFFRQQFAQVTNPAIDSLREKSVMSLTTRLGPSPSLFQPNGNSIRLELDSPVMLPQQLQQLLQYEKDFPAHCFSLYYRADESLELALESLWQKVQVAITDGKKCLIFSDKASLFEQNCIHPLIATSMINQRLIELGLRYKVSLLVESAFVRNPHEFACLIAFGASAIIPYLALNQIAQLVSQQVVTKPLSKALENYCHGIEKGLLKICSKMGISTINSYRSSQLFEIIGLSDEVVKRCFKGATSKLGGLSFEQLQQRTVNHQAQRAGLINHGYFSHHQDGEFHDYNPDVVTTLIQAVRQDSRELFNDFSRLVNQRTNKTVRDFFQIKSPRPPIDTTNVEPYQSIVHRFETAAMSLGAISPEAHQALALAMNQLGGKSNSGEGGEDPIRHESPSMSKIKQVASARFGVTADYLVNAQVIQIKISQGAKPGEGGQLPGKKVNHMIARLRFAKPGITLISPPPHHDIYSIEDLAQLIFDLKQVNPKAHVSVKLVAQPGIGTIAVGVAKAYADSITVSGFDGGTGASPLSSIKHAGSCWELGLIEVQQALQANSLRHRVRIIADGGLKTALDVVKAAILGAEGFGFGTAPLISLGCKYLRICHLNNCATGVATQDQRLREQYYHGHANHVVRYFTWLAQDVRVLLAQLGFEKLEQIIGRYDLLNPLHSDLLNWNKLNLSTPVNGPRFCSEKHNPSFDKALFAKQILDDVCHELEQDGEVELCYTIYNYHRSIGANLSGYLSQLSDLNKAVNLTFNGTAGQSFGVWNCHGLHLRLIGDANDYVAKGMSGGTVIIHPAADAGYRNDLNSVIAGNTCLYGATGGEAYFAGTVGERFCIRNSGATAIVEGVGDHGCEYMTGGCVVVLGATGVNFGAGMTGGEAFVFDESGQFEQCCNVELIELIKLEAGRHEKELQRLYGLIEQHYNHTNSIKAQNILDDFNAFQHKFYWVLPKGIVSHAGS